jgi:hypothetical protein
MDVYWLEQTRPDVPADNNWLSASEALRLNDMRIAKRRVRRLAYLTTLGGRGGPNVPNAQGHLD